MVTRSKVIAVAILTLLFGGWMAVESVRQLLVIGAPVVTGTVVSRTLVDRRLFPYVDLTIDVQGVQVHARAGKYLLNVIPNTVRFRYNGDPAREVFLFEHEESPHWIVLTCWGASAFLFALGSRWRPLDSWRRALGWNIDARPVSAPSDPD